MDREAGLRNPYISIDTGAGLSYGGSQEWFGGGVLKKYGCGAVALGDVLLYLDLYAVAFGEGRTRHAAEILPSKSTGAAGVFPKDEYLSFIKKMNRLYIHVIPGIGIPGAALSFAANRYFKHKKLPYRARFCTSSAKLDTRVEESLSHDLPVMMAIGKNLHFWQKKKLDLYRKKKGAYEKAQSVSGHLVVVTGLADGFFQVSSWGRKYYIPVKEYLEYSGKHSSFLISNICTVSRKDSGKDGIAHGKKPGKGGVKI